MTPHVPIRTDLSAPADITVMYSFAMDAWFDDAAVLTDEPLLTSLMHESCEAGGAVVLDCTSAIGPDGAITAALLLSQSHFSVRTWPASKVANFDLLTCGRLDGDHILEHLEAKIRPVRCSVVRTVRRVR
ncbi:S-adenosylmethionine decarboxylase family protein [Plantactinospora sp. CA-290183]